MERVAGLKAGSFPPCATRGFKQDYLPHKTDRMAAPPCLKDGRTNRLPVPGETVSIEHARMVVFGGISMRARLLPDESARP